jgi:hypothetical protein
MEKDARLNSLLKFCSRNGRVCPHPLEWEALWKILIAGKQKHQYQPPPRPLILAAWWESSNREKQHRLRQHIRWAYRHQILEKVDRYIRSLSEDEWFHSQN